MQARREHATVSPMREPREILKNVFGYDTFRLAQEDVITHVLEGRDTFVVMPTGGGKSLCYQIPALCLEGTALVISPLIALMKDQVDALISNGVRAACYNSSMGEKASRETLARLHQGDLDLLYVSPERLQQASFLQRLEEIQISMLAIDEAHCVSAWGHDFRPDYARLGGLKETLSHCPTLALTATADETTRADIVSQLRLRNPAVLVTGFDRPNITYRVDEKHQPGAQLEEIISRHEGESGIVYALSRKRVEQVAERLNKAGVRAGAYHAGLSDTVRKEVHEAFIRDELHVVVATVAFGMGIDKPDIRYVVHYDIPKNIEGYYQETGRAGRDGLPSEAVLLLGYQDVVTARALVENHGDPNQKRIELMKLNAMVGFAEALSCRREVLLRYFGEDLQEACGNCDVCVDPPVTFDGTQVAQMALSCIYRVNQRFGIRHVVDVLRGSEMERIKRLRHNELSTWGIGKEYADHEWTSFIRQLIHKGFVFQDVANYAVLKLTDKAGPLLRGEQSVELAKPKPVRKKGKKKKKKQVSRVAEDLNTADQEVFVLLRNVRMQLAKKAGIPPYMVFGDKTLKELAIRRPSTPEEFLEVHGVGEGKLSKYGDIFLETLSCGEIPSKQKQE